jgi:hypothetical protein
MFKTGDPAQKLAARRSGAKVGGANVGEPNNIHLPIKFIFYYDLRYFHS